MTGLSMPPISEEGSIVRDDDGRFESLELGLPFRVYVYGMTFPVPTLLPGGVE